MNEHNAVPGKLATPRLGAATRPVEAHARPVAIWLLIGLQFLLGVGAVFGGGVLILAPDGRLLRMPLEILDHSPFSNFLLPALLLFICLGVFPLVVGYSLWRQPAWRWPNWLNPFQRQHWSWAASLAVGVAVIIWITAQVFWVGLGWVHVLYLAWGGAIVALTLWPSVRRDGARPV